MKSSRNAFEYLVDRILRKRCVPLIGAGISMTSTKNGKEWNGHSVWEMLGKVVSPTVDMRIERLSKSARAAGDAVALCQSCFLAFADNIRQRLDLASGTCPMCELREAKQSRALTKACEAFLWERGGPNRKETYTELVKALHIDQFADLDPTSAHFHLAFLAREGLITEFVTTNYDCNLETAYRETWSNSRSPEIGPICAIYDLKSFAVGAADSAKWVAGEDTRHPLKVFKINGCAARLRERQSHATDILLTASQLQDWRARRWAADFFRTKIRMASLVTIGFGSDEPQVVHTLQQVLEEFAGFDSEPKGWGSDDLLASENAPIVTMYEPYPSFPQMQLAYGFSSWLTGNSTGGDELLIGPLQRPSRSQALGSGQARAAKGLTADELWADVFQAVFGQLLVRELRNAAATNSAAFTATIPYANSWLSSIAQGLEGNVASRMLPGASEAHWLTELTPKDAAPHARPPQLTRCVTHLLGQLDSLNRYTALSDHGSFFTELVLLFALLREASSLGAMPDDWQQVVLRGGSVLEVPIYVPGESGVPTPTSIFVSRTLTSTSGQLPQVGNSSRGAKRLELVLGAGANPLVDLERRTFAVSAQGQSPVTLIRLDWKALFPPDMPLKSYRDLSRRVKDAAHFPTKYRRRLDASVRTNPFLELNAVTSGL
ncbi:SIR2-like domain-containing protein [Burkholderia sp. WP9]|uniref:SIR2 family protein n=1 Tax=Burkholderia sp. WP9 TaxID=1500263 RepID=UPI00089C6B55|nr:SIR2 family protein [Burkholderia sp. WP9]SEB61524.1 SIR2-like domain-containing protein [Burkholderia sp. WP9]